MPTRKDPYWDERVKSLMANNRDWGAGKILRALDLESATTGREDVPSFRWVGQLLRKVKEDSQWLETSKQYRTFYWPESMERGDLPWEASAASIELLRKIIDDSLDYKDREERPPVRLVRWFWRVSLAAPDLDISDRINAAKTIATWELLGKQDHSWLRNVERLLLGGGDLHLPADLMPGPEGTIDSAMESIGIRRVGSPVEFHVAQARAINQAFPPESDAGSATKEKANG
jgi:hypothetical protein